MGAVLLNAAPCAPQSFPTGSLRGYGVNPFGEPVYRCVWSDSRLHQVGGRWPDGAVEYRWIPRYAEHAWVLEKWLSAFEFAGSREQYALTGRDPESGLFICGPYPDAGEYEHCYTIPAPVSRSMIIRVIEWIEAGRKFTPRELAAAHLADIERSRHNWLRRATDIWDNSQQAFGNLASNVNPAKRTADDMPLPGPAPARMPKGDGKAFTNGGGVPCHS